MYSIIKPQILDFFNNKGLISSQKMKNRQSMRNTFENSYAWVNLVFRIALKVGYFYSLIKCTRKFSSLHF